MMNPDLRPIRQNNPAAIQREDVPSRDPRVVLILTDPGFRAKLADFLRSEGFAIEEFGHFDAAIAHISDGSRIDAILVESGQLRRSCTEMLIQLRRSGIDAPVAVASPRYSESDEEAALAHGAADYLSLSRRSSIIGRRIQLLVDGVKTSPCVDDALSETISIGPLDLWMQSHRACWKNCRVPLTVTEFKIVRLLACRAGEGASYREIYDVVHGIGFLAGEGPEGHRNNVRSLIRNVRARFRTVDNAFAEIENLPGHGYRWRRSPASGDRDAIDIRRQGGRLQDRISRPPQERAETPMPQ